MTVHVQEYETKERALVGGVQGREVGWLTPTGVHSTIVRAGVLEVPRVPTAELDSGLGSTIGEVAETLASRLDMEILKVCHWPAGRVAGGDVPDAVGVILAKPLI